MRVISDLLEKVLQYLSKNRAHESRSSIPLILNNIYDACVDGGFDVSNYSTYHVTIATNHAVIAGIGGAATVVRRIPYNRGRPDAGA